jgi:hypothetical protein
MAATPAVVATIGQTEFFRSIEAFSLHALSATGPAAPPETYGFGTGGD